MNSINWPGKGGGGGGGLIENFAVDSRLIPVASEEERDKKCN